MRQQYRQDNYGEYGEYRAYLLATAKSNTQEHNRLLVNLRTALKGELTDRQRQVMVMYFVEQLNMRDIAEDLGINVSTVCRTIQRGKLRLQKCLKYGARELLASALNIEED